MNLYGLSYPRAAARRYTVFSEIPINVNSIGLIILSPCVLASDKTRALRPVARDPSAIKAEVEPVPEASPFPPRDDSKGIGGIPGQISLTNRDAPIALVLYSQNCHDSVPPVLSCHSKIAY